MYEFFKQASGIGPFKAQFCLAFAAELCVHATARTAAAAKLERAWVAGWGTGVALDRLLQKGGAETEKLRRMLPN